MTSHYSLPLHGGNISSHYRGADYDYVPRCSHRYAAADSLYGDSYGMAPPVLKKYPVGSRHHHHWKRQGISYSRNKVPFETAMDQVYATLTDAVSFFRDFDGSFASDISAIKAYASPAIIDELWKAKVLHLEKSYRQRSSPSSRRAAPVVDDGWGSGGDSSGNSLVIEGSFQEHIKRVRKDMEDAIYSRLPPRAERGGYTSGLYIDSMNRLREKLSIQHETLLRICGRIYKVPSYVHEFIKESELVLVYMDKTRSLWQPESVKDEDRGFGEEPADEEEGSSGAFAS
ncbi:hypothetical protein VTN00DRAFT_2529 [Thermoascus crustaceus]|uniref:uncharacterized protein n=1 Tax=Thermoascus crustaceus TaxID=5088 RepID=UPI003743B474